ncbi:hypothetical protein LZ554_001398 [Drepanopeziza brunnea f. sp. 'monogermtubi']|nr:hypothetical protein LZ554_001398 [Drepanopeziza brunnea f. sp. 'monogermtubi']
MLHESKIDYPFLPQAHQTVQEPTPFALKRPHAAYLEDLVDQLRSSSTPPKRYCSDLLVAYWLGYILGLEAYREKQFKSDTALGRSEFVPRRLTKSPPIMERRRNAFAIPSTPPISWCPPSAAPTTPISASASSGRKKRLVEDPLYRSKNLFANHIHLCSDNEPFPSHVADLVKDMHKDRKSPGPRSAQLPHDIQDLENLEMGTAEAAVKVCFESNIFEKPRGPEASILKRVDNLPMLSHAVPSTNPSFKVSDPKPDMVYGYGPGAFPQREQSTSMGKEAMANSEGLLYPFFVIEFEADRLWVATNQCLGASATCINIAQSLSNRLKQCESDQVRKLDSAAFSIAMNGTEARLYISWKHSELDYYTRKVDSFLLERPEDYGRFRKIVRNIIDWGRIKRLGEIRSSLDDLLEESGRVALQLAKSRE